MLPYLIVVGILFLPILWNMQNDINKLKMQVYQLNIRIGISNEEK